jgi:hypothetical protein|tara:strand:- start:58 stop:462 length:405 start_codon:yes stop_codon:yes gene_type:complete
MEHPYLFYVLFFVFGYVTCKAFYFLNATKKSIIILRSSQLIGLFVLSRALEDFYYAKEFRLGVMNEDGDSKQNITAVGYRFDEEVSTFKRKSIKKIIEAHGNFFDQLVDFNDWKSAMVFLEDNRKYIIDFVTRE